MPKVGELHRWLQVNGHDDRCDVLGGVRDRLRQWLAWLAAHRGTVARGLWGSVGAGGPLPAGSRSLCHQHRRPYRRVGVWNADAPPALSQFAGLPVDYGAGLDESSSCRLQGTPDPLPEFAGGGDRERDDQELVDAPVRLDDQAGDQGGQGVGLARARAGFDDQIAVERPGEGIVAPGLPTSAGIRSPQP